jgi:hypothetical protein
MGDVAGKACRQAKVVVDVLLERGGVAFIHGLLIVPYVFQLVCAENICACQQHLNRSSTYQHGSSCPFMTFFPANGAKAKQGDKVFFHKVPGEPNKHARGGALTRTSHNREGFVQAHGSFRAAQMSRSR